MTLASKNTSMCLILWEYILNWENNGLIFRFVEILKLRSRGNKKPILRGTYLVQNILLAQTIAQVIRQCRNTKDFMKLSLMRELQQFISILYSENVKLSGSF